MCAAVGVLHRNDADMDVTKLKPCGSFRKVRSLIPAQVLRHKALQFSSTYQDYAGLERARTRMLRTVISSIERA
jgi:hypothetical protein